jgi:predicted enzyme related to lactoylglutathione lyase
MVAAMSDTGRFVWYELLTTDPVAAIAFYAEVIGWKTQRFGDYTMFATAQGPVGGVNALPDAAKQMGAPPYWQGNVVVANVDESVAQVKLLGGRVIVAEDVPDVGRLAVILDPQGAAITLFTPARAMPPHDMKKLGEHPWHELYTTDVAAAFAFYQQIFGWDRIAEHSIGEHGTYLLFGRGGAPLGGMMRKPAQMPSAAWQYYITVDDLDGTIARAQTKGARVLVGAMPVPTGQRIAQLLDPQGAAFALMT